MIINSFLFTIGLAIGSFLNVLIDRLPKGEKITGRSKCDHCHKQLGFWDLIPVVSFITSGGKSRCCNKKLSWQYPLIEILTGLVFIFTKTILLKDSLLEGSSLFIYFGYFGVVSCLIVIFFADLKYQIIPDSIQIALFIFILILNLGLPFGALAKEGFVWNLEFRIWNFLLSGFIVMLPILFLWAVTKGRGMGFGDVKLALNMGFLLGIKNGLLALYLAFILGALVGLVLIFFKKNGLRSKIAFGPFLVLGTIAMFFCQKEIFYMINKIYGF